MAATVPVHKHDRFAPALLAAVGTLALAFGLLVYIADRGAHPLHLFGVLGLWLPSFVHPFAFSLYTAAAAWRSDSPPYYACGLWWAVNVAFEVGQHPAVSPFLPLHYFRHGTYDVGDLIAVTLGSMAAALLLMVFARVRRKRA